MSRDDESKPLRPGDAERLVLDLLYGELEGDAEQTARARVEGDAGLADELAAYGRLRSLLRELPDDEPSPALSAQLLHAAAETAAKPVRAPVVAASAGGWWSRLQSQFLLHPGVAALATLVLVAGVGGALYARGVGKTAQPTATSAAAPPAGLAGRGDMGLPQAAAPPPAVARTGGESDVSSPLHEARRDGQAPADASAVAAQLAGHAAPAGGNAEKKKPPAKADSYAENAKEVADSPAESEGDRAEGGFTGAARGRTTSTIDVTTPEVALDDAISNDEEARAVPADKRPSPSPPPPPPPTAQPAGTSGAGADDAKRDEESANVRAAKLKTKEAIVLANRGDCAAVEPIAAKVRALDTTVYDSELKGNAAISACREAQARARAEKGKADKRKAAESKPASK